MNNRTIRKAQPGNLFMDFALPSNETQEYHPSQKSRSLANLEELLFHVTQCKKSGDAHALKSLCLRLRHPLKSLNNSPLNRMVNEICFFEDDCLPAILTQSLEMLCRQLIDEVRAS